MGRIYRGRQEHLGRDVVLKILPIQVGADSEGTQKRFLREAAICSQLRHPNTVTVFDYGELSLGGLSAFYIAMEHIDGVSLDEVLRLSGRLRLDQALWVIWEVCRALREAHANGVIHRDLKPSNVMLRWTREGESVKILDFGISKLMSDSAEGLTMKDCIIGSPRYMAPEQVLDNTADARTDIYALGILLYQLVSGRLPFTTGGPTQIMLAHVREPVPDIRKHTGVPVPREVETLIRRCLEKDPQKRIQSIDELFEGMRALSWGRGLRGMEAAPPPAASILPEEEWAPEPTASVDVPDSTITRSPVPSSSIQTRARLIAAAIGAAVALAILAGMSVLDARAPEVAPAAEPEPVITVTIPAPGPAAPPAEPPAGQ